MWVGLLNVNILSFFENYDVTKRKLSPLDINEKKRKEKTSNGDD